MIYCSNWDWERTTKTYTEIDDGSQGRRTANRSEPRVDDAMRMEPPDDETIRRLGRRVSILEASFWIAGISIAFALPYWLGLAALPIVFYGTFAVLAWRLAKAMPIRSALWVAFLAAAGLTFVLMLMVQG